jgi:hypothetical protein
MDSKQEQLDGYQVERNNNRLNINPEITSVGGKISASFPRIICLKERMDDLIG